MYIIKAGQQPYEVIQKERLELTRKKRQEMEEHRAQAAEARARTEVRERHNTRAVTAAGTGSGREVEVIINELMSQKVISARDPLSFTLTEEELIVNGKKEDDAIRQRLKERLRVDAGDSFQYKRNGNSVTTTIVRN